MPRKIDLILSTHTSKNKNYNLVLVQTNKDKGYVSETGDDTSQLSTCNRTLNCIRNGVFSNHLFTDIPQNSKIDTSLLEYITYNNIKIAKGKEGKD